MRQRGLLIPPSGARRGLAKRWLGRLACTLLVIGTQSLPGSARAAAPEVGQVVSEAIEVRLAKRLPLPPGRWRVATVFDELLRLDAVVGRATQPKFVVVLANEDTSADIQVLVLEYTDAAAVSWSGQPCAQREQIAPLVSNPLGTTGSSLRVRCNRIYAFDNLRRLVQRVNINSPSWYQKRFSTLEPRAPSFPVHGLFADGYLSAFRGDFVKVVAYANPALHGLDDAPSARSPFRAIDSAGARASALREYLKAFTDWFDAYTHAIDNAYLDGSSPGGKTVAAFRFGAAPANTAVTPAAPALGAQNPPPAQPQATKPTPAADAPAPRQKVHALVIGNSAYATARLVNPRNDAKAVAERFRRFGFVVNTVLDATRKQMVEALTRFGDSARAADVAIVFYAGHGVQVNGVNYLIPVDMDLASARAVSVAYDAVSLNTLLESHLPGKAKLVFLDACRDNPLARSLAGARGSGQGLAAVNAASGTLISYATRDGSTASDGAGTNSPYTTALLAHLDEAEDISIVLRRVRQRVMTSTKGAQEPWEYGSLIGDKLVLSQISRSR